MQVDEPSNPGTRPPGPDQSNAGTMPQLSAKLRAKMDKLARWRIDPSSIMFPEGTNQFHGGHAMVSRAILAPNSGGVISPSYIENAGGYHDSGGNNLGQKAVAIKSVKVENEDDWEHILGLALREAGLLIELSHKNIITLEGFTEDLRENRIWLIFLWEDNGNLKDFVASQNLEIPERIWLIDDVTRGVEYLHSRDPPIYHGDLKSINVLVNSKYSAVITDFGSARRLSKKPKHPDTPTTQTEDRSEAPPPLDFRATFEASTNTMTFTGNEYTLRWAAPELLMDDEPGLWSDIWSLGWICYEVMTGSIPFENVKKDSVVIKQVIQGDLPSVTDHVRMSLILALCSVIIKCWDIDPSKRPTAEDCRKIITWLPMIPPGTQRASNVAVSGARNPQLLMKLGDMYADQQDYSNAEGCYTEALGLFTNVADDAGRAYALRMLAEVHRLRSEYRQAVALYTEAVQLYTHIGDRWGKADAELGLAELHRAQDEFSKAFMLYSDLLQVYTSTGNAQRQRRAFVLFGLGQVHTAQKERSRAVSLLSEAVQIYTDIGNEWGRASALLCLAEVHRVQNDYSEAITIYSKVLQVQTDIGNRFGRGYTLMGFGKAHHDQDDYATAVTFLEEAVQIFTDLGNRRERAMALSSLADVHRDQDHHMDAIRLYEQAAEIFEQIGNNEHGDEALAKAARLRS